MKHPFSLAARSSAFLSQHMRCPGGGFLCPERGHQSHHQGGPEGEPEAHRAAARLREAEYNRRNTELIGTLSENASLKAAMGLSLEQSNPASRSEVRRTIEDQLREMVTGARLRSVHS